MEKTVENAKKIVEDIMSRDGISSYKAFALKYDMDYNYLMQILNKHAKLSNKYWLQLMALLDKAQIPMDESQKAPAYNIDSSKIKITVEAIVDGVMVQSHTIKVEKV